MEKLSPSLNSIQRRLNFLERRSIYAGALVITSALLAIGLLALLKATAFPALEIGKLSSITLGGAIPMVVIGFGGAVLCVYKLIKLKRLADRFVTAEKTKVRSDRYAELISGIVSETPDSYHTYNDDHDRKVVIVHCRNHGIHQYSYHKDGSSTQRPNWSYSKHMAAVRENGFIPLKTLFS